MILLSQQKCVPCHGNVSPVSDEEIAQYQSQIPNWSINREKGVSFLERSFRLAHFQQALELAQRIGEIAEQQQHHPTLIVEWGQLTVQWWTHAINRLHQNDFVMAAKTDAIMEQSTS